MVIFLPSISYITVIIALPSPTATTFPLLSTVTTELSELSKEAVPFTEVFKIVKEILALSPFFKFNSFDKRLISGFGVLSFLNRPLLKIKKKTNTANITARIIITIIFFFLDFS